MHFDSSSFNNMTESNTFNVPMNVSEHNSVISSMVSNTNRNNYATQPSILDFNTQRQIMVEFPALSLLQGEQMNISHMDPSLANLVLRNAISNPSPSEQCPMGNEFDNGFVNGSGTLMSASSLAALLASRFGSQGNFNDIEAPPSLNPFELARTSIANNHQEIYNPAFKMGLHQFQLAEIIDQNQWISSSNANNPCGSSKYDKELSLSLATYQPPIVCGTVIQDQCSDISGSIITPNSYNERQFVSKSSYNNKNISPGFGSHGPAQIADQFSSGSRYLRVIQAILAQIASYSLENFDRVNYPASLTRSSLSPSCLSERDYSMVNSDVDGGFCTIRGRNFQAKKKQLVALLQMVDEQHNQCIDEIHTVISAFHAATELDPQIHSRFALQTVSALYKNLRERISNQILTMGSYNTNNDGERSPQDESSFETKFIQRQWALQQLRKKDQQFWRPQRGLPERSVSVLRAWMFQNFLHPYPKDAEKHLLAVKSGLTRSQVSNWFINARVRLWKPMIEEMYTEMNRRKGRRNNEETDNGLQSQVTIASQGFLGN